MGGIKKNKKTKDENREVINQTCCERAANMTDRGGEQSVSALMETLHAHFISPDTPQHYIKE